VERSSCGAGTPAPNAENRPRRNRGRAAHQGRVKSNIRECLQAPLPARPRQHTAWPIQAGVWLEWARTPLATPDDAAHELRTPSSQPPPASSRAEQALLLPTRRIDPRRNRGRAALQGRVKSYRREGLQAPWPPCLHQPGWPIQARVWLEWERAPFASPDDAVY
jgi:hypothetical protein